MKYLARSMNFFRVSQMRNHVMMLITGFITVIIIALTFCCHSVCPLLTSYPTVHCQLFCILAELFVWFYYFAVFISDGMNDGRQHVVTGALFIIVCNATMLFCAVVFCVIDFGDRLVEYNVLHLYLYQWYIVTCCLSTFLPVYKIQCIYVYIW